MRCKYETIFLLAPTLTEKETKEVINRYAKFFDSIGAKRTTFEEWGVRKLVYPINKFNEAYYFRYEFICEPEGVDKLNEQYNADSDILKHIIVRIDSGDEDYDDTRDSVHECEHPGDIQKAPDNAPPPTQPIVDALDVLLGFDHYAS